MAMNPRTTTEKIVNDYKQYVSTILKVKDKEITRLAKEEVDHAGFVKGPYLETTLPFVEGKSLKQLVDDGLVSREFAKLGKHVHYDDWKLRIHQEQALNHIIRDKRNMIVSTGTGSGKTECYLYPIFNELMREKEKGTLDAGVRALLIFPMNALANDQQKKLRGLLAEYPYITFGRYTGETAHNKINEDIEAAEKRLHEEYDIQHQNDTEIEQRKSIQNELMCREYMAENPPHILLTNYAMLEYMLLRPDTAAFFDTDKAKNWRFIVIDEAHTYKGAVGTEIAFLLRRLKERITHYMHDPFTCIATSATLGNSGGKASLAKFASDLFGEPFDENDVITTVRDNRKPTAKERSFIPSEYVELKKEVKTKGESEKGAFLYDHLVNDSRLFALYESLKDKPRDISEVADEVFSDAKTHAESEKALIDLIELAAAAKKSEFESALLPARYHLFVRSLEGMFVEFYPKKRVFLDRKEKYKDGSGIYSVFEMANCQKCGQEYIIGKKIIKDGKSYLVQTSSSEKPEFYFISDKEVKLEFDEDDSIDEKSNTSSLEKYRLCLACGRITPYTEKTIYDCCKSNDENKIVTVYNLKYTGKGKESNFCPACGAIKKGLIKRFLTANQPATFAVAKSLYDAIPPRAKKHNEIHNDSLFNDDLFANCSVENNIIDSNVVDESGRKLLVFSDNRQEAAFFAGFFEKKYRLAMWRRIIINTLKAADNFELSVDDLIAKTKQLADREGLYSLDIDPSEKCANEMSSEQKIEMAAKYVMQEFISPDISIGLEGMGYVQIEPEELPLDESAERYGVKGGKNIWKLYRFILDTLRQKGTVRFPQPIDQEDEFFFPRNHSGYFRESGSKIIKKGSKNLSKSAYVYSFMPTEGHENKRSVMFKKILNRQGLYDDKDSLSIRNLKACYGDIINNFSRLGYIDADEKVTNEGQTYTLSYKKWKFRYIQPDEKLYRCKKCGKIFSYSILNICPEFKCSGELEEIEAREIRNDNYYDSLYSGNQYIPMVAREHTAQLSANTAGQYQKMFEEGSINVLSCSTTFEMGVDVGELEATFQRNVPPETSNYIQRAGRAGRRTSSAAFSVTFARRNSHDMTFFQNPSAIIAGKISAPILEIENEKIASRHLNSVIVSEFFKRFPDYYNGNTKRIISYEDNDSMDIALKNYLDSHPKELLEKIHNIFDVKICNALGIDEWKFEDCLVGADGSLTRAVKERHNDISNLNECKKDIGCGSTSNELHKAESIEKLIQTLNKEASISFLCAKGILPKYGFPIDSVSLDILNNDSHDAEKLDLSRDLRMAISEFAPPAQIVANGKLWNSYAINVIPEKGWPTYRYYECPKCRRIYPPEAEMIDILTDTQNDIKVCESCGEEMHAKKFIIPLFGFSTSRIEKPKQVDESRPRAYYSTQTQFWNDTDLTESQQKDVKKQIIDFGGKTVVKKYSPGGKLFVLNQGTNGAGLYVCPECGFTTEVEKLPKNGEHKNKFGKECSNKHLQRVSLGHQFSTDILKITLPEHEVVQKNEDTIDKKDQYLSVMYAILEGASAYLDINRNDINGCVTANHELILYDDTPGGSGFVKNIYFNLEEVLSAAKEKVNGSCGCTEETSCYGCLRNYENQYYHDILSRGLAYHYLDWLLNSSVSHGDIEYINKDLPYDKVVSKDINCGDKVINGFDCSIYANKRVTFEEIWNDVENSQYSRVEIETCKKLKDIIGNNNTENPVMFDGIDLDEGKIWPIAFWPDSHVALFGISESQCQQYDKLKIYNWNCYKLDDKLNYKQLLSLIRNEE